ncbi:MAG: PDZ domain-containing protein, partial [Pseudomonadota bacterium]
SNSGGSVGLGLSVPASMVARVVFDAHHHGELRRPWLGIESHDMSWEQAQALGLDVPIGVAVQKLHMAGSAARSGVQKGDILLELDGKPVRNFANLAFQAATHSPGAVLPLKLLRKGELVKTKLMLTVPDDAGNQPVTLGPATPMAGASAIQITPRAIQRFDLDLELQGVILADVPQHSAASNNGLKSGDVVLSINGTRITDIAQITEIQPGTIRGWDMVLLRQNRQIRLQFF